jgi:hypothetical protein
MDLQTTVQELQERIAKLEASAPRRRIYNQKQAAAPQYVGSKIEAPAR